MPNILKIVTRLFIYSGLGKSRTLMIIYDARKHTNTVHQYEYKIWPIQLLKKNPFLTVIINFLLFHEFSIPII